MFGIGETELVIIIVFGFLLFGPDKLPSMGRTIGRMLRQFREAQEGFSSVVQSEVMNPLQEAMSDPSSKEAKEKAEARAKALAEDEDDDDADSSARLETFAERRERLRREREAKAQAELAKKAEAEAESEASDVDVVSDSQDEAEKADSESQVSKKPTAASLYALKPNKED